MDAPVLKRNRERGLACMDSVARLSDREREQLFRETSANDGRFSALIAEKDFWVCWILKKLFEGPELQSELIFKGGTSLSKIYNAIERFSEDIDLSISRKLFGFTGENDPAQPKMGTKERKRKLEQLHEITSDYICNSLRNNLITSIQEVLNDSTLWSLDVAPDDKDQQTLLFRYPASVRPSAEFNYITQSVRLEFGTRSDFWPKETAHITPFAAEQFPGLFEQKQSQVECLTVNRTFWEKVTLLHALHHKKIGQKLPERSSRHYYDTYRLLKRKEKLHIDVKNINLLGIVREHKMVFFKSSWAHYETAIPGSLKLIPPNSRHSELSEDYRLTLRDMIYGYSPPLEEIFEELHNFEKKFNTPV